MEPVIPCKECNKPCTPIAVATRIDSSEHYCPHCHLSYPMDREVATYHLQREQSQQPTRR